MPDNRIQTLSPGETMLCKNSIHELRSPRDLIGNDCRGCHNNRQHRYDDRRKLAMHLLRQMEAAGIRKSDLKETDGYAIALAWTAAADEDELARIEKEHPTLIAKVRRRLELIEAGR